MRVRSDVPLMKQNTRFALAAVSLLIISIAFAPVAHASTLNVDLNPNTKVAVVKSVSTTSIVLTYPSNSSLSQMLKGYTSSKSISGNFTGSSDASQLIQGRFDDEDSNAKVQNMAVSFTLNAKGNSTALVINKETDITASVTGVFTVVNGTVHANLGWRAFAVPGEMTLTLQDQSVDVNLVGSAMSEQLSDHPVLASLLFGMFGGDDIWHRPTLNFSALNTPLSTWTRNYNSITNTTTFSKTISGESSLFVSASFNGQKYTLSVKSDPSANIATQGYATATNNALVIGTTPLLLMPALWAIGGVVVAAGVVIGIVLMRRSRTSASSRPKSPAFNSTIE